MEDLKLSPCPCCDMIPQLAYVCGEYFIFSENTNCECNKFPLMCSNHTNLAKAWNEYVKSLANTV